MSTTENTQAPRRGRVGIAYNCFNGEELLESSIKAMRQCPSVAFIAVIYQTVSNFGTPCSKELVPLLERLRAEGLVDCLCKHETLLNPTPQQKWSTISHFMTMEDMGGSPTRVQGCFVNEVMMRQKGFEIVKNCRLGDGSEQGKGGTGDDGIHMDYHMTMDTDEYYKPEEFEAAVSFLDANPSYDCSVCKFKNYYKRPTYVLCPDDELNHVPFMNRIRRDEGYVAEQLNAAGDAVVRGNTLEQQFLLGTPYPVLVDPTRGLAGCHHVKVFNRGELEMHHMTLVRTRPGMMSKLLNVSNRANYNCDPSVFVQQLAQFEVPRGSVVVNGPLPSTTPHFAKTYTHVKVVDNFFNVPYDMCERDSP